MATTNSVNQHAPSPAQSHDVGLDEGFQHLQDFNKSIDTRHEAQYYPDPPDYYGQDTGHDPNVLGLGLHTVSARPIKTASKDSVTDESSVRANTIIRSPMKTTLEKSNR